MANYSTLKAAVADVVKTNGTQAITGANLQAVLLSIINSVGGGGYIFKGVATPSTDAGTPDENVFYIGGAGTYANFGTSVTVPVGSICVFKYNGSWTKEQVKLFDGIDATPVFGSTNLLESGGVVTTELATKEKQAVAGIEIGYYYRTDQATIPTTKSAALVMGTVQIEVTEGEQYMIKGQGYDDNRYRLYAFGDSSRNRIERFSTGGDYRNNPVLVTIPTGAAYMVVNYFQYDATTDGLYKLTGGYIDSQDLKTGVTSLSSEFYDFKKIDPSTGLESGGISIDSQKGLNFDSSTRARTADFITAPFSVDVRNGFKFYHLFRYPTDAVLNETLATDFTNITSYRKLDITDTNYKYRISFTKTDNTQTITGDELGDICYTFTGYNYELNKITTLDNPTYGNIVDVGGIRNDASIGRNLEKSTRARNADFITAPFIAEIRTGFKFFLLFKYPLNAVLNDTLAVEATDISGAKSIDITDTNYKYRISFTKTDNTQTITNDEVDDVCYFSTGYNYIIKHDIDNIEVDTTQNGKFYLSKIGTSFITDYTTLINSYDALVNLYPDCLTKNTLGQTTEGATLYEYVISGGNYNKNGVRGSRDSAIAKPIFAVMAGVHGDERCAINSLYLIIRDLLQGNNNLSPLFENAELHFIPCVCPYGFNNFSRTNYNGVNVNRNFNANWVYGGDGTNNYSGPSAASELETQIAQTWIQSMATAGAKFVFDWHNSGFTNEVSCLVCGGSSMTGIDDLKHYFLVNALNIAATLIASYDVPQGSIFSYTASENAGGYSNTYIAQQGLLGGYVETSWNVDGKGINTPSSAAIGASVLGNVFTGYLNLYNIL